MMQRQYSINNDIVSSNSSFFLNGDDEFDSDSSSTTTTASIDDHHHHRRRTRFYYNSLLVQEHEEMFRLLLQSALQNRLGFGFGNEEEGNDRDIYSRLPKSISVKSEDYLEVSAQAVNKNGGRSNRDHSSTATTLQNFVKIEMSKLSNSSILPIISFIIVKSRIVAAAVWRVWRNTILSLGLEDGMWWVCEEYLGCKAIWNDSLGERFKINFDLLELQEDEQYFQRYMFASGCEGVFYFQTDGTHKGRKILISPFLQQVLIVPPILMHMPHERIRTTLGVGISGNNIIKVVCVMSTLMETTITSIAKVFTIGAQEWRPVPCPNNMLVCTHTIPIFEHGFIYWNLAKSTQLLCFDVSMEIFTFVAAPLRENDVKKDDDAEEEEDDDDEEEEEDQLVDIYMDWSDGDVVGAAVIELAVTVAEGFLRIALLYSLSIILFFDMLAISVCFDMALAILCTSGASSLQHVSSELWPLPLYLLAEHRFL
uniref:F-box associated beta-propeller type 3 domain-containing protein n=1 Tax=Cannabis sativa TaxID=3483 RepID=A0A803PJN0_CANSA